MSLFFCMICLLFEGKILYLLFIYIVILWSVAVTQMSPWCFWRYRQRQLVRVWTCFLRLTVSSLVITLSQRCFFFHIHDPYPCAFLAEHRKSGTVTHFFQRATTPWLWLISLIGVMSHVLYFLIKSASRADGIWEQHILIRRSRICISERENGRKRGRG